MPDLYADHCNQIAGMVRNHEIDRIETLLVRSVDIVNVRYTEKPDQREFTALFTASARDYYVDDRNGKFLRGDAKPERFQEFWTFQRQGDSWLLREVEQTRESDALKDENFFEQFTDKGRDEVYGETAGPGGPVGTWLEKGVSKKADRIERMLNFLVKTDPLWHRTDMIRRVRQVFTSLFLAQERGDPAGIPAGDLFPDLGEGLRAELTRRRELGVSVEYRNLCVRKVELVLIRNQADDRMDEFTTRISAHAQKILKRGGREVSRDPYVSPFVQFWVFGRLDGQWKLKEILPEGTGRQAISMENIDQDSNPEMVQWYYRHTRAT